MAPCTASTCVWGWDGFTLRSFPRALAPGRWPPSRWSQGSFLPPSLARPAPPVIREPRASPMLPQMRTPARPHASRIPGEDGSEIDPSSYHMPPPPEERRKPRRGQAATSEVLARAAELGLTGPLGLDSTPEGASRGGSFARRLESELLASASDAWDVPRLSSALTWVGPFVEATGRTLF